MDNIFANGILKGRVAFVTGGGTGITGGVARALAEAGASVALVSRKLEHLEPAAAIINDGGGKAFAVAADVRNPEEVEKAIAETVAHFGKIDIVVPVSDQNSVKVLLGKGRTLRGRLLAYDALEMTFREYRVKRDPNCAVCGDHPSIQHPEDLAWACAATSLTTEARA